MDEGGARPLEAHAACSAWYSIAFCSTLRFKSVESMRTKVYPTSAPGLRRFRARFNPGIRQICLSFALHCSPAPFLLAIRPTCGPTFKPTENRLCECKRSIPASNTLYPGKNGKVSRGGRAVSARGRSMRSGSRGSGSSSLNAFCPSPRCQTRDWCP